jgi:hypothetical protein
MATSVSRRLNILYMYTFRDFILQMGSPYQISCLTDGKPMKPVAEETVVKRKKRDCDPESETCGNKYSNF